MPTSYRDLNLKAATVCLFASLGALTFGFDNGWWGFILGETAFLDFYGTVAKVVKDGTVSHTLSTAQTSAGTGTAQAGIMLGVMVSPFVSERLGRKICFMVLASIIVIGSIIQATSVMSHSYWHLVVGKVVVNYGIGIASGVVGLYLAECAPASVRGAFLNLYTTSQFLGNFIAGATVFGVTGKTGKIVWVLPIGLQFIVPLILLLGVPFLPESPRWLISKNRLDEAFKSLRALRKSTEPQMIVEAELQELKQAYDHSVEAQAGTGWLDLFRGSNRRRTMVAVGVQCLQQAQGVSYLSNYLVITFIALGLQNVQMLVTILYAFLLLSSFLGFYVPDKIGRRKTLIGGAIGMGICFLIVSCIATANASPKGSLGKLLIAATFIWFFFFSFTWSPMAWTVSSEIPSAALRSKTLALSAWSGFAVGLIVTFVSPYIQAATIKGVPFEAKIGFIWFGFSSIGSFFAFFFVPELKGRSLEELDLMFEAGVPTRAFASFDITTLQTTQNRDQSVAGDYDTKEIVKEDGNVVVTAVRSV